MIQPTKERENVHIRWVCQHHSLQLHSCPSHMKETGLATKYLFHLFRLYVHVQVSSNHSSAQYYSCLSQVLGVVTQPGSTDFKHHFHPQENLSASWKDCHLLPFPPTMKTYTHTSTYMVNGMNPKSFFSAYLERKFWKLFNANVPEARQPAVNNS